MKRFRGVEKKVDPPDPLDPPVFFLNEKLRSTGDRENPHKGKQGGSGGSSGSKDPFEGPVGQVTAPLRTGRGQNDRGHHMALARVKKQHREQACILSFTALSPRTWSKDRIALVRPWWVRLVRVSPGTCELDDDNLRGSLKAVRDGVADRLHVDDGDKHAVRFFYAQERGPWAVRIEFHLTRPENDDE